MGDDLILSKRAQLVRQLRVGAREVLGRVGRPPEVLILGAQKAGTTSLYSLLTAHPDVAGALTKEVHYFSWNYRRSWRWYLAHFPRRPPEVFAVEACPDYLFHPLAPQRITERLPETRAIVVLRDPTERALSHYFHSRRLGQEDRDIDTALFTSSTQVRADGDRIARAAIARSQAFEHHSYLERGHYAEQLARLWTSLPKHQTRVVFLEELVQAAGEARDAVFDFLQLPRPESSHLAVRNPGSHDLVEAHVSARLREYFAPQDAALQELLGRDVPWQPPNRTTR